MPKRVVSSFCENCIGSMFGNKRCAVYKSCDRFGICERCCDGCENVIISNTNTNPTYLRAGIITLD